jgi:hypothetical protein
MVDSVAPSGTDPDNKTIMTNSNDKLEVIESTQYYLASFEDNYSGDWTGITSVDNGTAEVSVDKSELPVSASVTADLTGIDVLTFRIDCNDVNVKIKVDGIELVTVEADGWKTVEISGLDEYDFGANSTLTIEAYEAIDNYVAAFYINYIRTNKIQSESEYTKMELVDTGGLP